MAKKKERVFHSFDEIEEHYSPKEYERKKIEKMSLKELAKYQVDKSFEKIRKELGL